MIISNAVLLAALLVHPADSTRQVQAYRLPEAVGQPTIDGRLDEEVWGRAENASGFTQVEPRPGDPASQATEARVLYSGDAIYVSMRMYDSAPDSIAAQLARRDPPGIYSDWAHIAIDSYNDNRTAFRFSVNPRGVKADAYHYDDSRDDSGWDAVWEAATAIDSLGWTAEFRIPFSQLRYSTRAGGEQLWGVQFVREIARTNETSLWSPMPPNSNRVVSSFGEIRGLMDISSPRRLELQPYTVGKVTRAPGDANNPFYSRTQPGLAAGADLKYGLTSDFTLSATVNPDFGQVEADPAVVNLSAYETFLPERRPFFVEGMDIFRFGVGMGDDNNEQLFYSRRIGRRPQHQVAASSGYVDAPEATTILAAGKVSGKTSNGWSLGVLNAVTAREEARYIEPESAGELTRTVEPMTNYGVFRAIRNLNDGRSGIGGILSTTHRRLEDHLSYLPTASYAGGIDLRHRFGGGAYEVRSWLLGSRVEGDSSAIDRLQRSPARRYQRPDATHLRYDPTRTALGGWAASTQVSRVGGGHWNYGALLNVRSPGFDVNDLGFQRDADMAVQAAYLGYNQYEPGPLFRNWWIGTNQWYGTTFGGERLALGGNVNGGFQLPSFWGANGGINREAESNSTGALRGGPSIISPSSTNAWWNVYSDRRKSVRFSVNGNLSSESETVGRSWRVGPSVTLRPSTQAELSVSPSYSRNVSAWQFIGSQSVSANPRYLFGRMDQQTAALTARLSYTFTPDFSLQFYGQPFISAGRFSDFRYVADPRAGSFDARLPVFASDLEQLESEPGSGWYAADLNGDGATDVRLRNPDFNVKQFRSNAVLRWEYLPGSTLFLVWSQGRGAAVNEGSFALGRDVSRLFDSDPEFGAPATNVLLIKLNYWLDF